MSYIGVDDRLARERRARLQAERLLAQRSEELYSANKKLAEHAHALSHQVIEQRQENAALLGRTTQTEAALEVATEKAVVAERRLWDALRAVEDGFAIFDRDWRLVTANPAYLSAFDGVADIAPGASYEAVLRIAVDEGVVDLDGAAPARWIASMIARWEAPEIAQTDIRLWNGSYVRLIDKRTPDGDIVSLAVDITQTIRREQDLSRARDAAEAAAHAKSTFLANMSHEIRTPMNGIVSMADLLCETKLAEDQRLYAETIRNSGDALLVIINDVLDFSKIEAGKLALHPESFDLQSMVHEVFRLLQPGLQGKDVTLELDYDIFLPDRILGDRGRIRQILINLIGNAVKFTERGRVTVQIVGVPRLHPPEELPLRIVVEDTGVGIPREMQKHIFGEFNQADSAQTRRHDGTGLGLAITRRLVEMMGGEVWLDSEPGVGSAFGVSLILAPDPAASDDPVPPLPEGRRRIAVLGAAAHLPPAILDHLLHVRAEVVDWPPGGPAPGGDPVDAMLIADHKAVAGLSADGMPHRLIGIGPPDPSVNAAVTWCPADITRAGFHALLAAVPPPAPVALPAPSPAPAEPAELGPVQTAPKASRRRLRVLAAEDNKTNRLVFKTMLKPLDIDLLLVENGRLAVEAYRNHQPDLVFTDISMPVLDGIEATRQIRRIEAEEGWPAVRIVAMTAHARPEDAERILAAGLDVCLTKPLRKADLWAELKSASPEGVDPFPTA